MSRTSQTLLRPFSVAEQSSIGAVVGSESEWRDALVRDPALLEAVLGSSIDSIEPEPAVGPFSADLAVSAPGLEALVELQTGPSDARHLGQVLRYALLGNADLVIWLADEVQQVDARAVAELNKVLSTKILPVTVHTLRVPESGGFVQFPRVVEGREFALGRGLSEGPSTARDLAYVRFWRLFVAAINSAGLPVFGTHNPGRQKWIRTPVLFGSSAYVRVAVAGSYVRVGLQLDTGDDNQTALLWSEFMAHRDVVEDAVDAELDWQEPGRTGVIEAKLLGGGYQERPELGVENAVEAVEQFYEAARKVLSRVSWGTLQASSSLQRTLS